MITLGPTDSRPRIGPFVLCSVLDTGGMGTIWLARHETTGLEVAVKLADRLFDDGDVARRFRLEVEALAKLDHPNVVRIFDYGVVPEDATRPLVPGTFYLVMEYASRGSLRNLRRPIDWMDLLAIARSVLSGLAHAHARGVVHRDLKPGNILLGSSDDPRPNLKLADFGIAYAVEKHLPYLPDACPHGETEDAVGTPTYMAPEQFMGYWRDYGPWTDLYAVGVLLWELACEVPPFDGATSYEIGLKHITSKLPEFRPTIEVPDGFERWLRTMLAKNRAHRFQWATDALRELGALDEMTPAPRRVSLDYRARYEPTEARRIMQGTGLGAFGMASPAPVGRAAEQAAIEGAVARAACDLGPTLAVVCGASGSGTTHLAKHTCSLAAERGLVSHLFVAASRGTGLSPLVRTLVERFRGVGLRVDDLKLRIWEACQTLAVPVPRVAAVVDAIDESADPFAAPRAPDEVAEALLDFFEHLAAERPLALVIDDIDASAEVADFVRRLMTRRSPGALRIAVVATARSAPDERSLLGQLEHAAVPLQPLGPDAMGRVLDARLPLEPGLRAQIIDQGSGMPGRVVRLLGEYVEAQRLVAGDSGYELASDGAPDEVGARPSVAESRSRPVPPDTVRRHWANHVGAVTSDATIRLDSLRCGTPIARPAALVDVDDDTFPMLRTAG